MKPISVFLLIITLFCSSALSESGFIESSQSYWEKGKFNIVYDEKNDIYWAVVPNLIYIGDVVLPFIVRYDVFWISEDFSQIEKSFSSPHQKFDMYVSDNGLWYERERLLSMEAVTIYEYNPKTDQSKKIIPYPVRGLLGSMNGNPLYANGESILNLYCYDSISKKETLIANKVIPGVMNAYNLFYKGNNGHAYVYSLEDMKSRTVDFPQNISDINNNGYMLDDDNCLLYTPEGEVINVDFISGAKSIDLQDGQLYAIHEEGSKKYIRYIHLNRSDDIITVELPEDKNMCVVICNNKAFLSNSREHEIRYVDLFTEKSGNVSLPRSAINKFITNRGWLVLTFPVFLIWAIHGIRKFYNYYKKQNGLRNDTLI